MGLATSAILFALTLNTPFVKDPEATYAIDIRAAMRGDWLLVHTLGRKPPVYVWFGAAMSALHGSVTEVTSRMPGVIAGGALCALLFGFAARRMDRSTALWSWLVLLSMPGFVTNCVTAQVDPMLVLWTFAALLAFYPIAAQEKHGRWLVIGAGIALGLGILSKGPIAVVIVGGTIAVWFALMHKSPTHFLRRSALAGVVALLIAASWYLTAMIQGGREFARVLYAENFGHFLPGGAGGTGEAGRPLYYIAAHLIGASFPIVILLPAAAIAAWSELDSDRRSLLIYFGSAVLTVTLFFSLASSKREVYVMAALPTLALLIGASIAEYGAGLAARASRLAFRIAVAVFLFRLGAVTVGLIFTQWSVAQILKIGLHSTDRMLINLIADTAAGRDPWLWGAAVATAFAGALIVIGIWRGRIGYQSTGMVAAALILTILWAGVIRPLLAQTRTEKYFLKRVQAALRSSDLHLVALDEPDIEADYYLDRELPVVNRRDLPAILGPVYLLARSDALARVPGLKLVMSGAAKSGHGGMALAKYNSLEP